MSTNNMFINNINELYGNISIYRAIIVANNDKEIISFYNKFKNTNHNPNYYENGDIDYSYRLYLVKKDNFKKLIETINKDEYNFIAFSYNIDNLNNYIKFFLDNSNNNINEIYIHNVETLNNNIIYNKYN